MGFEIMDGPEIEQADYNFTKLNAPENHPSRDWTDTFYLTEDSSVLLRSQTSPMQIRAMEGYGVPIRMISAGRVYRKDEVDATHLPHCSTRSRDWWWTRASPWRTSRGR